MAGRTCEGQLTASGFPPHLWDVSQRRVAGRFGPPLEVYVALALWGSLRSDNILVSDHLANSWASGNAIRSVEEERRARKGRRGRRDRRKEEGCMARLRRRKRNGRGGGGEEEEDDKEAEEEEEEEGEPTDEPTEAQQEEEEEEDEG